MNQDKEKLIKKFREMNINSDVIDAFENVRRENFILSESYEMAYGDYPLQVGNGQTISQPTTIMIMLHALELKKDDIVLEIGAGSGYNAALISRIVKKIDTIEIIKDLVDFATDNLKDFDNVSVIYSDGSNGIEGMMFDKIIITCAVKKLPFKLIKQLKEGGIILAPIESYFGQKMIKGRKIESKIKYEELGAFVFVPMTNDLR